MEATVNIATRRVSCFWKKPTFAGRRRPRCGLLPNTFISGRNSVKDENGIGESALSSGDMRSICCSTNAEDYFHWLENSSSSEAQNYDDSSKCTRSSLSSVPHRRLSHRIITSRRGILSLTGYGLTNLLCGLMKCWGVSEDALIVLEAWKIVDEYFLDETFGGNNWSKVKYEILSENDFLSRDKAYAVIQEMLGRLHDPFTRLLRPDEYEDLRKGTVGFLFGIGLEVTFRRSDNVLVVVAPFPGGPADKAGFLPGDEIRSIDKQDISSLSLYEISQKLQGPIGSECIIDARHPFEDFEIKMVVREQVPILPVQYRVCPVGLHEADQIEFSALFKNQQFEHRWTKDTFDIDEAHKDITVLREADHSRLESAHPTTKFSTSGVLTTEINDPYRPKALGVQQKIEIDVNSIINSGVDIVVEGNENKSSQQILEKINRDAFKKGLASQVFQPNGDSDFKEFGCFAYIRISFFSRLTAQAVQAALGRLQEMNISGYIIDVRNNGGGLLESSIEVTRLLLDEGKIVSIVSRNGTKETYYASNSAVVSRDCPLVLLVNRRTASASEVFVGALKDNQRAIVVGERTCGKGVIQSVVPLSDGSAVAITVAKYETPRKVNVNKTGIVPDRPSPYPLPIDDPDSLCDVLDFDVIKVLFRDPYNNDANNNHDHI